MICKAYVGTYTDKDSEGIYSFLYNGKQIYEASLFAKVNNPKYLSFVEEYIAAVVDFDKGSGLIIYDKDAKVISQLAYENSTSCYLYYEKPYIYTANYHEGSLSVLEFKDNTLKFIKKIIIKEKAGSHQVLLTEDKILVPCLFLDKIIIINKNTLEIENSINFEENAGPRHAVFSSDNKYLYVVGELSNRLYAVDMQKLEVVNKIDLLLNEESFIKDSAAIRRSGNYIYVSTRTKDVISVIKFDKENLNRLQVNTCYGEHPRDFIIVKNEDLQDDNLIIANRLSNEISLVSTKNHLICKEISKIKVPQAISIIIKEI